MGRLTFTLALCALLAAARGHAQPAPEPDPWAAARPAIARGEALFGASNYGAALVEYNAAYNALAGYPRRFAVLNNIAACHERLFQYELAVKLYERYLREGGSDADDRAEVEARIRMLERLLVSLTIATNVPADIWVDDRQVGRAPGTIRVAPGNHVIELRAPLHEVVRKEAKLAADASVHMVFELERLSQYSGLDPGYFWTFAGLTVAAFGVGTGFGIAALQADREGESRAQRDRYLNTKEDEEHVKRLARTADVLFVGGAVFGVSAAVLFFLTHWGEPTETPERAPEPQLMTTGSAWAIGVRSTF